MQLLHGCEIVVRSQTVFVAFFDLVVSCVPLVEYHGLLEFYRYHLNHNRECTVPVDVHHARRVCHPFHDDCFQLHLLKTIAVILMFHLESLQCRGTIRPGDQFGSPRLVKNAILLRRHQLLLPVLIRPQPWIVFGYPDIPVISVVDVIHVELVVRTRLEQLVRVVVRSTKVHLMKGVACWVVIARPALLLARTRLVGFSIVGLGLNVHPIVIVEDYQFVLQVNRFDVLVH
mmetsp:Transcript_6740/g.15573  ORF Transcript_6740/g.15573 Transcript_6740/m.15573 type:complete len:230 (+) Transcript_6740:604-1293(+)